MTESKRLCGECSKEKGSDYCYFCCCNTKNKYLVFCSDEIKMSDSISAKQKRQGFRGYMRKTFSGFEISGDKKKHPDGVYRFMDINRKDDRYDEKVVDKKTGQITRYCHGKLSEHTGRGSAKSRDE
jgi:hypothetical protein